MDHIDAAIEAFEVCQGTLRERLIAAIDAHDRSRKGRPSRYLELMREPNIGAIRSMVTYDPETGGFQTIKTGKPRYLKIDSGGYYRLEIGRKKYLAHRVAWLLTHGKWPDHLVDHIDRNRRNNRLINLRAATPAENRRNTTGGIGTTPRPPRQEPSVVKVDRDQKVCAAINEGLSRQSVAERFSISPSRVGQIVRLQKLREPVT